MPFRDPETRRAHDRARYRKRTAERLAAGLCPRCGKFPPSPGRSLCEGCARKACAAGRARDARLRAEGKPRRDREKARAAERRRYRRHVAERAAYASRRSAGSCTRCGDPATDGAWQCIRCAALEIKRGRPERRNAASRRRYWKRRAAGRCTDCNRPAHGASRCEPCAKRSYERSQFFRGIPVWDPGFTVIELATGETHGPFDTEAEAAASLSFSGLGFDEVVILNDAPETARFTAQAPLG